MAALSPYDSGASSPLSSLASQSPPPPDLYPSPSSQRSLDTATPTPEHGLSTPARDADGPPPAKKRRIMAPKPRTTEYLNLQPARPCFEPDQKAQVDLLLKALRKRKKIVVVAGAGISVSAGIPDFRSSSGLFKTLRTRHSLKASGKHLFDASVYRTAADTSSFHDMVRSLAQLVQSSKPSPFHHMLASLAHEGRLLRLYTQNVDCIDTSLMPLATNVPLNGKGPWPRTIQLHGGLAKMVCQKCNHLSDFQPSLFDGPEAPTCRECETMDSVRINIAGKRSHGVGKLRPRIVLYNEYNPDEEAIGAVTRADLRTRPDALIVVGTSLKVPGVRRIVREMCGVVRSRRDGVAIWINPGPEPVGKGFEDCWDLIVKANSDTVARLANMKRWDGSEPDGFEEVNEDDWAKMKARGDPQVVVESPRKSKGVKRPHGVLTPTSSPQPKASKGAAAETKVQSKLKKDGRQQKAPATLQPPKKGKITKPAAKRAPVKEAPVSKASQKINTLFKVKKPSLVKSGTKAMANMPFASIDSKKEEPVGPTPPPSSENESETQKRQMTKSSTLARLSTKAQSIRLRLNPASSNVK